MRKSVIKYQIASIKEVNGYDSRTGKSCIQKEAEMWVVATQDQNDPNYVYGQVSGGSTQTLKTINPDVYNTWSVGAIVSCEMEVSTAQ